ncbi:MAG TPA: sugar ABC transporter substrate-binding protein [Gaiellaceae bacterium]|nr:sugar ABC transporter substrate-binding protein [Gaiellaceae bacterium]
MDSDQPHDEHGATPADPQEQHEVAMDRRHLLKRVGLGAAALSVPTAIMASPAMGAVTDALAADSFIKSHPKWKFTFVNHVTTNPFFVPTIYGAQDACSLLGCSYQWTGSATSDVSQMVNAFNSAISANAAGISCCLVDLKAFNAPTAKALGKGIPVLAYNADVPTGNPNERLAYIGQDLYASGYAMGQRIVNLVKEGDVALFIATPGQLNIQPRIDGATAAIKKLSGGKIKTSAIATGSQLNDEIAKIDAYYLGHKNLKGMFAVDAGSTQAVGQTVQKYKLRSKGVKAGGYDLTPTTLKFIQTNQLDFTIDQQPYLQGFLPVLQLFFYRYSSGLVAPSNTNTGILFVTKQNVGPYISSKTRYEGSSSAQKYPIS